MATNLEKPLSLPASMPPFSLAVQKYISLGKKRRKVTFFGKIIVKLSRLFKWHVTTLEKLSQIMWQ